MNYPVKLSIIIVTHNSGLVLSECLIALNRNTSLAIELIVVDNASSDDTVSILEAHRDILVRRNSENVGFASACNQGFALASGEYFVLLNPDAIVHYHSLDKLVRWLDGHPSVGVVGPVTEDETGSVRDYQTCRPKILNVGFRQLLGSRKRHPVLETDWVSGFCLVSRRKVLDYIGGLDEGFFMYSEDIDWCLRAKRAGWKVVLLDTVRVVHHGAHSAASDYTAWVFNVKQGKLRLFGRHYRYSAYLMLKVVLGAEAVLKLCWDASIYLVTPAQTRARRAARMLGYWTLLRYLGERPRFMLPGSCGSLVSPR